MTESKTETPESTDAAQELIDAIVEGGVENVCDALNIEKNELQGLLKNTFTADHSMVEASKIANAAKVAATFQKHVADIYLDTVDEVTKPSIANEMAKQHCGVSK